MIAKVTVHRFASALGIRTRFKSSVRIRTENRITRRVLGVQNSRQHQLVGAVVASPPSSDGRTADTKTYRGG